MRAISQFILKIQNQIEFFAGGRLTIKAACSNQGRCSLCRDLILFSESSNAPAQFCPAMDIDYGTFYRPDDWQLIGRWIQ